PGTTTTPGTTTRTGTATAATTANATTTGSGASPHALALGSLDGVISQDAEVVYSGDGARIAAGDPRGAVVIDATTGKTLHTLRTGPCDHVALSKRGDRIACGGRILDVDSGDDVTPADG